MNEIWLPGICFALYVLFMCLILTWQQMHYLKKDVRKLEDELRDLKYKR